MVNAEVLVYQNVSQRDYPAPIDVSVLLSQFVRQFARGLADDSKSSSKNVSQVLIFQELVLCESLRALSQKPRLL